MKIPSFVTLQLPRSMVGQILDGLEVLAADWEFTCEVDGAACCPVDEDRHVRECSGATEAAAIAATYREILAEIYQQVEKMSGSSPGRHGSPRPRR